YCVGCSQRGTDDDFGHACQSIAKRFGGCATEMVIPDFSDNPLADVVLVIYIVAHPETNRWSARTRIDAYSVSVSAQTDRRFRDSPSPWARGRLVDGLELSATP